MSSDLDLVIRHGTVIDGTGRAGFAGDVAIRGDRIVAVGTVDARGTREIDATDRYVTPGFVDLHTHLDAQIGWDPLLTSSCWHGVTSVVMGNCGVTFAPVRTTDREFLAEMMESVEDIPARSILDGIPWSWETYGEYLDALDRLPKGINAGGMVGHCAVRYHAMGDRSLTAEPGDPPSASELAAMCALVDEAVAAGALGFSSSRTLRHRVPDGRFVPGTWAESDELVALASMLRARGRGVVECAPRFDGDGPAEPRVESELAWMRAVALASGRPVTFNLSQTRAQGDHYRLAMELAVASNERDATRIRPQTTSKCVGVVFALASSTPFDRYPAWATLKDLPLDAKLAALRERRAELVADALTADDPWAGMDAFFVVDGRPEIRYDNDPASSLAAVARSRGTTPVEAFVDLCLETEGRFVLQWPLLNQELDAIEEMITSEVVLMGLADAGAHVGQIIDASQPTYFLTYWVRERAVMSIEEGVRRLTSDTADFMGIPDRGVLRPGAFADVNVIDWDGLGLAMPEFLHDFPYGAGRWTQRGTGYDATVVNGAVAFESGEHTGAHAGTVLRSGPDVRERGR
ncbi:MAG: N-acyl-D-amino-acid deacylase family protein [Acidimicrobiia bacterium]